MPEKQIRPRSLSQIAAGYLIRVSRECPSSVTAQASLIALRCKEANLDPQQLGDALLKDELRLNRLKRVANYYHRKNGMTAFEVDTDSVARVVEADFKNAHYLMNEDSAWLIEISTSLYEEAKRVKRISGGSIEANLTELMNPCPRSYLGHF